MLKKTPVALLCVGLIISGAVLASDYQFNAESKPATNTTKTKNQDVYKHLDFANKTDFENIDKGFIAPLINNGNIDGLIDVTGMNFMQTKDAPPSVNPSLWRHAQLVNRGGLYKVSEHIYQVRGQDISNLTIIETNSGIVLYDVEYSTDSFQRSIALYEKERGKKPLKGVIISHSHADHFGGFGGIYASGLATPEDISSGKIPFLAPEGFVHEAVSENVMAGNIMSRRAGYQYGNMLKPGPTGSITAALGPAVVNGKSTLPLPNKTISKDGEKVSIDGVDFIFYLTPGAEAPAEMVMYIPQWKALSMAEEVNHLQHNIYTLRGAQTRDASQWASYINSAIARWGHDVEVQFGPHTWPVWGNQNVVEYLKDQRDAYQSIYNTTIRYANYGYRPDDIAENAKLPEKVFKKWDNRPYYGSTHNNLKSTYIKNLGWFSGNAAELAKYPDAARGERYVKALGGEQKVVELAVQSYKEGDYRFTTDLLNNIVSYDSSDKNANYLMADALEQLGYQEENALYRNLYLSAAHELRVGGGVPNKLSTASPEVIAALPPEMLISYMSMISDQIKAEKIGNHTIELDMDNNKFILDLHNGVLNYIKRTEDMPAQKTDVKVKIAKTDLVAVTAGQENMDDLLSNGKVQIDGDRQILQQIVSTLDTKIKNDMNLVLPLQKANQIQQQQ
ncbi:MBL fold metallo-hydrolase [Klebsiella variicola]|uniref:alkyl/aryl-sulfatase n=1 Tax=Klebsiella variicola TaxID=244366 RepID=UPI0012DFC1BF|nr:alkyl sulfatase dimerization domain-containing protein [Klebsiella variicola]MUM52701.1 MBL fold metallo-hydrolase [Klebsiella variicola]MUM58112.1 MBL fold metallo-hydrolase [Klebsiella variicola]